MVRGDILLSYGTILSRTTNQVLSHTTFNPIQWQAEYIVGGSSWWSATPNPERMTVPAGVDGMYGEVFAHVQNFSVGNPRIELKKNGSVVTRSWEVRSTTNTHWHAVRTGVIQFTAGDYWQIDTRTDTQASGASTIGGFSTHLSALTYGRQGFVRALPISGFVNNSSSTQGPVWNEIIDTANTKSPTSSYDFIAPPGCRCAVISAMNFNPAGGTGRFHVYKNGVIYVSTPNDNNAQFSNAPGLLAVMDVSPGDLVRPVYQFSTTNYYDVEVYIEWLSSVADQGPKTGTGALIVPATVIAGTGEIADLVVGSGGFVIPTTVISGSGDVNAGGAVTGTGNIVIPAASLSGSGTAIGTVTGTGDLGVPATALAGTGIVNTTQTGTGGLTSAAAILAGTGAVNTTVSGTGNLPIPAAALSGSGTGFTVITGTGDLPIPSAALAGSGDVLSGATGTGALTMPSVATSGSGTVTSSVSGSGDLVAPAAQIAGRDVPWEFFFNRDNLVFSGANLNNINPLVAPGSYSTIISGTLPADATRGIKYSDAISGYVRLNNAMAGSGRTVIFVTRANGNADDRTLMLDMNQGGGSQYIGAAEDGSSSTALSQNATFSGFRRDGVNYANNITRNQLWDDVLKTPDTRLNVWAIRGVSQYTDLIPLAYHIGVGIWFYEGDLLAFGILPDGTDAEIDAAMQWAVNSLGDEVRAMGQPSLTSAAAILAGNGIVNTTQTGTGALTMPSVAMSGSGDVFSVIGTGNLTIPATAMSATGSVTGVVPQENVFRGFHMYGPSGNWSASAGFAEIDYSTVDYDTTAAVGGANASTGYFTVPADLDGARMQFSAHVRGNNSSGNHGLAIYRSQTGGSTWEGLARFDLGARTGEGCTTPILTVAEGEIFRVSAYSSTSSALLECSFTGVAY